MTRTQTLEVDVRMDTDPLRAQMLALADMYEQAAAAMRAGVERIDELDEEPREVSERLPTICIYCKELFRRPEYVRHLQACHDAHKDDPPQLPKPMDFDEVEADPLRFMDSHESLRAAFAEALTVARDLADYVDSLDHREPSVVAATARHRLDQLEDT